MELCLVGGYTFQQYFMLYDELPTRFVIEPNKTQDKAVRAKTRKHHWYQTTYKQEENYKKE